MIGALVCAPTRFRAKIGFRSRRLFTPHVVSRSANRRLAGWPDITVENRHNVAIHPAAIGTSSFLGLLPASINGPIRTFVATIAFRFHRN